MSRQRCLICSSNKGFFLDIYLEGKNYRDSIEQCLSIKIKRGTIRSTKICHKCAYQVNQCSKFVVKYNTAHGSGQKGQKKRGVCNLCMESGQKGLIFSLGDDDIALENSKKKLHAIFNQDFIMDQMENISVCLDCRYNMDVLYDLKHNYEDFKNQQSSDEESDSSSDLQKKKTDVMKRQTIPLKSLKSVEEKLDPEKVSPVTKKKSKRLAPFIKSKSNERGRECDECHEIIEVSVDMYRIHHSGSTVCKNCWLKTDPNDSPVTKKRKVVQKSRTKLCSVFLEDIFSSSTDNKNNNLQDKIGNNEPLNDISDDHIDEMKIKKSLRNSQLKTKEIPTTKKADKQEKIAPKKEIKNNKLSQKNVRNTRSESIESIPESDIVRAARSRSKALQKKKHEVSQIQSKNLEKTRAEQRGKKLRLQRLQKRSKDNSNPSLPATKISKPKKTQKNGEDLITNEDSDSENSRPYTCNVCSTDYENRVEGMKHELTHSKKLGVVIEKCGTSENNENDPTSNEDKVDALTSETSRNIVEDTPDFSPMTSENDDNNIDSANKVNNDKLNEAIEVAMNATKNIDDDFSEDVNHKNLSENIINKEQYQNIDDINQSENVANDNQSESIVTKSSSQSCHNEELSTKKVINDEDNIKAGEQISTDDQRNASNLDTKTVDEGEENFKAKDSNFEIEKSNTDVDRNYCHDNRVNKNSNEVNQCSDDENRNSDNESNKPEEIVAEHEKNDNTMDNSVNNDNKTNDEYTVNNERKEESSIDQGKDINNCQTEILNEPNTGINKKSKEPSCPNQTYTDSTRIENEDSQSEEEVNESSKNNTEKELEVAKTNNEQVVIDDKTESESKLDDYDDNLVIDERVDSLESSTNTLGEKDESEKVDKLQKIINASFGNSFQE